MGHTKNENKAVWGADIHTANHDSPSDLPAGGGCTHHRPPATARSASSAHHETHNQQLKYAKATELANTHLNLQAQTTKVRGLQLDTAKAITKIHSICGHAEGFAENMLHKAADGQAPDLVTT